MSDNCDPPTGENDWTGCLVNGLITDDPDEYVQSWQELGKAVTTLMPHWRTLSFDPGFTFAVGKYGSAEVSVELATAIQKLLSEKKER